MPSFNLIEILADIPEFIALVQKVGAEYQKLPPPAQRAPHDYVAFFNAVDEQIVDLLEKVLSQIKTASPPPAPSPVPVPVPVPAPAPSPAPTPPPEHQCPPGFHWIDAPGAPGGGGCVPD